MTSDFAGGQQSIYPIVALSHLSPCSAITFSKEVTENRLRTLETHRMAVFHLISSWFRIHSTLALLEILPAMCHLSFCPYDRGHESHASRNCLCLTQLSQYYFNSMNCFFILPKYSPKRCSQNVTHSSLKVSPWRQVSTALLLISGWANLFLSCLFLPASPTQFS